MSEKDTFPFCLVGKVFTKGEYRCLITEVIYNPLNKTAKIYVHPDIGSKDFDTEVWAIEDIKGL